MPLSCFSVFILSIELRLITQRSWWSFRQKSFTRSEFIEDSSESLHYYHFGLHFTITPYTNWTNNEHRYSREETTDLCLLAYQIKWNDSWQKTFGNLGSRIRSTYFIWRDRPSLYLWRRTWCFRKPFICGWLAPSKSSSCSLMGFNVS